MIRVPVLMYHNIETPPKHERLSSLYTSPAQFHRQMMILSLLGYKGLSMKDALPYLRGEKFGKVVVITFDDGYLDNYIHALPSLSKYGFTATCYIVSNLFGQKNTWSYGKNIKECQLMSKSQISEWLKAGLDIGSHTQNHVHLTQIPITQAQAEIEGSKKQLEDEFSYPINHFCYPYGEWSHEIRDLVHKSAYTTATTTYRKRFDPSDDLLKIPRVHMTRRTTALHFLAKILTSYEDHR